MFVENRSRQLRPLQYGTTAFYGSNTGQPPRSPPTGCADAVAGASSECRHTAHAKAYFCSLGEMERSAPERCLGGRFPDDSIQRSPHAVIGRARGSSSGSSSTLVPRDDEQDTHRGRAFRADSLHRFPLVRPAGESVPGAALVQEDGVTAVTRSRAAGRLQARTMSSVRKVSDVSLATNDTRTTRAGRQLSEIQASAHSRSAVVEDAPFHSTTASGLSPDTAMQQQLQLTEQQWLSRRTHQQLLYEHHQLRCGRMPPLYPQGHYILGTEVRAVSPQHPPGYTWLQCGQPQGYEMFQKQPQVEQPLLQQLHPPEGSRPVCHSAAAVAPSFPAFRSVAPIVAQQAASEPADTKTTTVCPFDRLRMLGRNSCSGTTSGGTFATADDPAHAPELQSNAATELPEVPAMKGVGEGRSGSSLSAMPVELPSELPREALSLATYPSKPPSPLLYVVASDAVKTAACPGALGTREVNTPQVVGDSAASAAVVNAFDVLSSTSSASSAPTFRRRSSAINSQECVLGSAVGIHSESRTGTANDVSITTCSSFRRAAVSSIQSDSAGECASSSPEAVSAPLRAAAVSAAGETKRCNAYASAGHLPSPPGAAPSAGSTRGAEWLLTGGLLLRRGSSIASGPCTSTNESSVRTTADGELGNLALACAIKESDDEPVRSGELRHLSDEVRQRRGEVPAVNLICLRGLDKVQRHQPQEETQASGHETQQGDRQQQQKKQQPATHFLGQQHQHKKQRHIQHLEKCEAVVTEQRDGGEDEGVLHHSPGPASVAFDGSDLSVRMRAHRCSDLQESLFSILSDTAVAGPECSGVNRSGRRLHEGVREHKVGAFENDASPSTVQAGSEKTHSCVYVGSRCSASRSGGIGAAAVGTPSHGVTELPGYSVQEQPSVAPVAGALSCAASVAPTRAASWDTTDSGYESGNLPGAACAAVGGTSAAADHASPVSRSFRTLRPVRRCPPQGPGSLCAAESSLPSFVTHALLSQRCQKLLEQHATHSVGTTVYRVPQCAVTAGRDFSPGACTAHVQRSLLAGSGNVYTVNVGAGTPSPTSFSTAAVQAFLGRPTEASWAGHPAESGSFTCRVLPLERDCSPISPGRTREADTRCSFQAMYQSGTPAGASATSCSSLAVRNDVAVGTSSRSGFPSYPTCLTGCGYRRELLPTGAVLRTDAAGEAVTWTGHLFSTNRMAGDQEMRLRRPQWVSHPVLPAQQQVLRGSNRSARRRSLCCLKEERERRQLRVVSGIVGALLVLGILWRGIGIVLFHTASYAVSKDKLHVSHSPKDHEHPRSLWNSPTADQLQVTSYPDLTEAPSAMSLLSRFLNANIWTRTSTRASHKEAVAAADLSASARRAGTPALPSSGLASFSCRIAHIAHALLVRLSARRRRSLEVRISRASDPGWSGAAGENSKRGDEGRYFDGIFTRTRWRRREHHGSSPIGALLLFLAFLIRKIIGMVAAVLQILVVYPLGYVLRSLIYVTLRVSASFACTAFAFVYTGRLIMERLKAFRIACIPAPSSFVFSPPSGSNERTASDNSNSVHAGLSGTPSAQENTVHDEDSGTAEALDTSVLSGIFSSLVQLSLCRGSNTKARQQPQCPSACDKERISARTCADGVTTCTAADENCVSLVGGALALATVRGQGLAVLGHLTGVILRRSLHASKAVAAHVFPLASVAASAAVSMVVAAESSSTQRFNPIDDDQREAAVVPEHDTRLSHRRHSGTPHAEKQAAQVTSSD